MNVRKGSFESGRSESALRIEKAITHTKTIQKLEFQIALVIVSNMMCQLRMREEQMPSPHTFMIKLYHRLGWHYLQQIKLQLKSQSIALDLVPIGCGIGGPVHGDIDTAASRDRNCTSVGIPL